MGCRPMASVHFAFLFCSLLAASVARQAGCPGGWRQAGESCYRRTDSTLRHDQLTSTCRRMGGEPVSIHNAAENDIVADVARGSYVWIGLEVTESNIFEWEDGSRFSYAKFLPSGNSMLKRRFPGAGIFQQNCKRWNYGNKSTQRYGICKASIQRCPRGSLDRDGQCYIVSSERVPWWEARSTCHQERPGAEVADLGHKDWRLNNAITDFFGEAIELLVQVKLGGGEIPSEEGCNYTTVQYGQRANRTCQFGCAELYNVLCRYPKTPPTTGAEPVQPLRMMPPMYKDSGSDWPSTSLEIQNCPPGWTPRDNRCISEPTQPAPRARAEAYCQQLNSSRLATLRTSECGSIFALQLRGVTEAWVRDERPPSARQRRASRVTYSAPEPLTQPGYSALTADGEVTERQPETFLPSICEHCQVPCGPGAVAFLGHCYRLLDGEYSLDDASRACAQLGPGGILVSVESPAENRFVTALAFPSGSAQCSQSEPGTWLGLHRISVSNPWEWEDCGPVSSELWQPGAGATGHCALLGKEGLWRDSAYCEQLRMQAVCEWDPCAEPGRPAGNCVRYITPGSIY